MGVSDGRKLEMRWIKKDFLEKNGLFSDEEVCREGWVLQYFQQWKLDYPVQSVDCRHCIAYGE